jgi:hypothetical protein
MTDHNGDLTGPNEASAVDRPLLRTDLDPIAIVTELVGDDPSVAELVAFRDAMPDLQFAAREARRLADEAMRLRNRTESLEAVRSAVAGLTLVGLGFKALVAIWPSDDLDAVDAKLALAEATGPQLNEEADYTPSLSPEIATRIRIKRAAFHVGELVVPAGAATPSASDNGPTKWPLRRLDRTSLMPPRGGSTAVARRSLRPGPGLSRTCLTSASSPSASSA